MAASERRLGTDGTARLWPLEGGAPLVLAPGAGRIASATFTPDSAKVVVGAEDGRLRVWPRIGGEPLVLPAAGYPGGAVLSPDGAWIAVVSRDSQPTLVRADGFGEPVRLRAPGMDDSDPRVFSMSFSPDGSRVAAASVTGTRIWRIDRPGEAEVVLPASFRFQAVFHPTGKMLVTSSGWGLPELRFWSVDGRELRSFNRLGGPSVAWSPDGERLETGAVRVERLDRRGEPIILNGHESMVVYVSFAHDGRLATASTDTTARLWLVDWAGLVAALRSATTACLTPSERTSYLGETPADADAAWASCERRFGRAP